MATKERFSRGCLPSRLPLNGIIVLDFGDEPLALAGCLLAALGADVIRVEHCAGDALRRRGPFAGDQPDLERSLAHLRYNAGKRSLALNLDHPQAWDVLDGLTAHADILIAPLDKSPLAVHFFTEARLRKVAPWPGVIDAVFRRTEPTAVATDLIGTAAGGLLYLNGDPADPPNYPAGKLAYKQTALAAAVAACSLVLAHDGGVPGGWITVAMQEAVMWTTIQTANENYWFWHRQRITRQGIEGLGGRIVFPTRDERWVAFYYQHPPAWPAVARWIAEALGETRFSAPEWNEAEHRYQHRHEIAACLAALCQALPRDTLVEEAQQRGILVVPVHGVRDIAADPHLQARGFFAHVWHEQLQQAVPLTRAPFTASAYTAEVRPAPRLGAHSREILADLGELDEQTIATLISAGIVAAPDAGGKA
jgi:benzylsuccinate CoA-transferase BbsE subunit